MASYDQLLNQNGTIFNQGARVAYNDPNQLAADLGTTADKIQWGSIAKAGANFDPTGYFGYTAPNTKAPVPSADLNTSSVMPPAPATSNPSPFVGGITDSQKYFQDLYTKQTADFEAQQKERDDLKRILGEGYEKLNTYGDVYKQTESSFGIPKMYEDLNKLNLQVADLAGIYDKEFARVETKGIQSGTAGVFYQGEQAAIQRQKAVEIGALSVRQAAMAGNLDLANQRLEKVLEIKYKPVENQIQQTLKFLELNYDDMNAAERRQADSLGIALQLQQQVVQEEKAKSKENVNLAMAAGTSTKFVNKNGEFFNTATGQTYETPEEFFKDAGVSSFEDAYKKGLVTDLSNARLADIDFISQLRSKYPDAGIQLNDSSSTATAKLKNSRIYQDEVRGPVGPVIPTLGSTPIIDPSTDAGIKALIASKPGDGGYGDAYKAVASKYGEIAAKKFDTVFQDVFNKGTSVDAAFNNLKLGASSIPTEYQGALDVILGSDKFTKEQKASVTNAIKSGQDPFSVIKNQAKNIMGQTNASKLDNYETAKTQLVDIQNALNQYYASGGKTDIFKGNYEKAINKLGQVKDPNLVQIATQIQGALQQYRNAVSGTAYSVQEGVDIASIFPGINKSEGLNAAIIAGRMQAFDSTIDSQYRNILGNSYDQIKSSLGEIKVRLKLTGEEGTIPANEFDPNIYEKI